MRNTIQICIFLSLFILGFSLDDSSHNFASVLGGASIIAKSEKTQKAASILNEDKDKYLMIPKGQEQKFVVIGLSEEIKVKRIQIVNFEFFSNFVKDFEIYGTTTFPSKCNSTVCSEGWEFFGNFTAEPNHDVQTFTLPTPIVARYIKLNISSIHSANNYYVTLSIIRVFGSSLFEDIREEINKENKKKGILYVTPWILNETDSSIVSYLRLEERICPKENYSDPEKIELQKIKEIPLDELQEVEEVVDKEVDIDNDNVLNQLHKRLKDIEGSKKFLSSQVEDLMKDIDKIKEISLPEMKKIETIMEERFKEFFSFVYHFCEQNKTDELEQTAKYTQEIQSLQKQMQNYFMATCCILFVGFFVVALLVFNLYQRNNEEKEFIISSPLSEPSEFIITNPSTPKKRSNDQNSRKTVLKTPPRSKSEMNLKKLL